MMLAEHWKRKGKLLKNVHMVDDSMGELGNHLNTYGLSNVVGGGIIGYAWNGNTKDSVIRTLKPLVKSEDVLLVLDWDSTLLSKNTRNMSEADWNDPEKLDEELKALVKSSKNWAICSANEGLAKPTPLYKEKWTRLMKAALGNFMATLRFATCGQVEVRACLVAQAPSAPSASNPPGGSTTDAFKPYSDIKGFDIDGDSFGWLEPIPGLPSGDRLNVNDPRVQRIIKDFKGKDKDKLDEIRKRRGDAAWTENGKGHKYYMLSEAPGVVTARGGNDRYDKGKFKEWMEDNRESGLGVCRMQPNNLDGNYRDYPKNCTESASNGAAKDIKTYRVHCSGLGDQYCIKPYAYKCPYMCSQLCTTGSRGKGKSSDDKTRNNKAAVDKGVYDQVFLRRDGEDAQYCVAKIGQGRGRCEKQVTVKLGEEKRRFCHVMNVTPRDDPDSCHMDSDFSGLDCDTCKKMFPHCSLSNSNARRR